MSTSTKHEPKPETAVLFSNKQDGRIACTKHAGAYFRAAHDKNPNRASYSTPLGTWVRWTVIDENAWRAHFNRPASCEDCGATI